MDKIGGRLGAEYTTDKEWVEQTDKRASQARGTARRVVSSRPVGGGALTRPRLAPAQKHERLEAELNAAKANSVKARRCCKAPLPVSALTRLRL